MSLYRAWYEESVQSPETFWAKRARECVSWFSPWQSIMQGDFAKGQCRWFQGATLNLSYNCLDRHLPLRGDKPALIWVGDEPLQQQTFTYRELHQKVCQCANALLALGIKRADSVCIYLPMIPEAVIAMLACARIGALHSVVFAGFSADALQVRLQDAACRYLITANVAKRGGKIIPLKEIADRALQNGPNVKRVLVVDHGAKATPWQSDRDRFWHDAMADASTDHIAEPLAATDPLFILYTSGSTGKPKGVLHAQGGYAVHVALSFRTYFDPQEDDVYWCSADVGWITGHSYVVYGPLMHGATTLMFEGVPHYPSFARYWEIIDTHRVSIFYTSPTAIRALRREGDEWLSTSSRKTLRLLGTVGEPINPEAWRWYFDVVGEKRCPIVDTWWQTETGGIMIAPIPGVTPLKPGSASWPFFGVVPEIVDDTGHSLPQDQLGRLVLSQAWPGMLQTIYGDEERLLTTYMQAVPGCYLTGDQAHQDADGYFWIAGRNDDVIKVSGHRLGTEEIESALMLHEAVAEAAAIGMMDEITGQAIMVFVVGVQGTTSSHELTQEVIMQVRSSIGPIATPKQVLWVDGLPKTRSGKIMRRLLRKLASGERDDLGDLSTLADPRVVDAILKVL